MKNEIMLALALIIGYVVFWAFVWGAGIIIVLHFVRKWW